MTNRTRLYVDDDEMLRKAEFIVNFKPNKIVPAINAVWDIFDGKIDLSAFSRPSH